MDIVYLLVPLSLVLVFLIAVVFWWALRCGQFEDMEGPAHRILMDEDHGTVAGHCAAAPVAAVPAAACETAATRIV
jgi:cbb3-type cytochrome oxidase maturation protein